MHSDRRSGVGVWCGPSLPRAIILVEELVSSGEVYDWATSRGVFGHGYSGGDVGGEVDDSVSLDMSRIVPVS